MLSRSIDRTSYRSVCDQHADGHPHCGLAAFASFAILAMVLMIGIAREHTTIRTQFLSASSRPGGSSVHQSHSRAAVWLGLGILCLLMPECCSEASSFNCAPVVFPGDQKKTT